MARMEVMTMMMEKTPTRMPSKVRAERSLWATMAVRAIMKLSFNSAARILSAFMGRLPLFVAQGIDRVHAGGAPSGQKAGGHARQDRSQDRQTHDRKGNLDGKIR